MTPAALREVAMHILVVGGTRFLGPRVVALLRGAGHTVTVFHRGITEADLGPEVRHVHGDRRDLAAYRDRFVTVRPDVVLDTRLFTEEDARETVKTFRGLAARLVAVSSIDVYRAYGRLHRTEPGPPDPVPLAEDAPLREKPSIEGARSDKPAVERVVMSDPRLPATVLRLPAVYGPGDFQRRLYPYARRITDGRRRILLDAGFAGWRFSHGYVEDVARAVVLAIENDRAAGRIYNVAEAETPPRAEWIRRIGRATGWRFDVVTAPRERLPPHLAEDLATEQHWVADSSRIRDELGYRELVPEAEGFRRTLGWEQANPPDRVGPGEFDYAAEDAVVNALGKDG